MQSLLVAKCRGDFLHSLLAVHVYPQPIVLQDMRKSMERTDLVQEKGIEMCAFDTSRTHPKNVTFAHAIRCVLPKHALFRRPGPTSAPSSRLGIPGGSA